MIGAEHPLVTVLKERVAKVIAGAVSRDGPAEARWQDWTPEAAAAVQETLEGLVEYRVIPRSLFDVIKGTYRG